MSNQPRILAFAGSTRRQSYNKSLVHIAATGARQAGAHVMVVDLADYSMPLFDEDLEREAGLPEKARRLRSRMLEYHGILLASPEYNGSLTAVLKNTLDGLSRPQSDGRSPFDNKLTCPMSASPGGLGGLRGLSHARTVLTHPGVMVLPRQLALPRAHEAFDDAGALIDRGRRDAVPVLGRQLTRLTRALMQTREPPQRTAA